MVSSLGKDEAGSGYTSTDSINRSSFSSSFKPPNPSRLSLHRLKSPFGGATAPEFESTTDGALILQISLSRPSKVGTSPGFLDRRLKLPKTGLPEPTNLLPISNFRRQTNPISKLSSSDKDGASPLMSCSGESSSSIFWIPPGFA
ncbi:hypothetical protein COLO4_27434 [Corchorus olitorius]|uniref:Uncharacterized protein n=1 Tax=Corchorus olitorius TaxID=93759 RepID=A0A1R3HR06_9ROSI|nr:hypothetical protein COLO4_27434 [Corchorus olitorius]